MAELHALKLVAREKEKPRQKIYSNCSSTCAHTWCRSKDSARTEVQTQDFEKSAQHRIVHNTPATALIWFIKWPRSEGPLSAKAMRITATNSFRTVLKELFRRIKNRYRQNTKTEVKTLSRFNLRKESQQPSLILTSFHEIVAWVIYER